MRILALDLGTKTGWAWWEEGSIIFSGTTEFKAGRYEGGGMRYLKFGQWLDAVTKQAPTLVVFEEVRNHVGTDAAHVYGGFMATLTAWCENKRVPYEGVPVGTIKKQWAGKGNAPKEVMMQIARERGFDPEDDNEADALALMHWAMIFRKPVKERRRARV